MEYLMRKHFKKKNIIHYWNGRDTYCKMYLSGGLSKGKYEVTQENNGYQICAMCTVNFKKVKL